MAPLVLFGLVPRAAAVLQVMAAAAAMVGRLSPYSELGKDLQGIKATNWNHLTSVEGLPRRLHVSSVRRCQPRSRAALLRPHPRGRRRGIAILHQRRLRLNPSHFLEQDLVCDIAPPHHERRDESVRVAHHTLREPRHGGERNAAMGAVLACQEAMEYRNGRDVYPAPRRSKL